MTTYYIGNAADNIVTGSPTDENIMFGFDGEDDLTGGSENDQLVGGNGDDDLFGGSGHDEIWGQNDNDDLFGGSGRDMLAGGDGKDTLNGGTHADRLYGEAGDDTIIYDQGDVIMDGGADEDTLESNGNITLGLGNIENMEIIDLVALGGANQLHGSGSFTVFGGGVPLSFTNLVTPDDVSSATDASNTLEVKGGDFDKVLVDTDWTWTGVNGDSQNVFIGTDSAGDTVTLNIDLNVDYGFA